jgi:hypothetical protein
MTDDWSLGSLLLEIEAERRVALHANHVSNRPLSDDYEFVGLAGEAEFACVFKQPLDLNAKPSGDGNIDFIVPLAFSVDVKTARKAIHLIHEHGKPVADIYVLAEYSDDTRRAKLTGWEYGAKLAAAPIKDFGHGVLNHYIHRDSLRSIADLLRRVMHLEMRRT